MVLASFMIPVMNTALVLGVAFVLPRSMTMRFRWWLPAALSVAVALMLEPGVLAACFVAPWLLLGIVGGVRAVRGRAVWSAVIAGFAGTAALALIASRLEVTLFDIPEPIVKLTALHFTWAGAGTLALAVRLRTLRPGRWSALARGLVAVAPPVVAVGFITRSAVGQVGGAALMTLGVWLVAALQLSDARCAGGVARWLWWASCLSPVIAMGLAVAWAANQYFPSVPALTVPDMVPTHGALNAFGFVTCAHLAAWHADAQGTARAET